MRYDEIEAVAKLQIGQENACSDSTRNFCYGVHL